MATTDVILEVYEGEPQPFALLKGNEHVKDENGEIRRWENWEEAFQYAQENLTDEEDGKHD